MAQPAFGYYPDSQGAPHPSHSYYGHGAPPPPPAPAQPYAPYQTPVGYPAPPASNGYAHPPSPQQARPHTAAPFAAAAHPPPPMHYYGAPPMSNGQAGAVSPPPPAPPQLNGAGAPPAPPAGKDKVQGMFSALENSPDMQEAMFRYLSDLRLSKDGAAADRGMIPSPAPRPRSTSSAAMPPPAVPIPQSSQQPRYYNHSSALASAAPAPSPPNSTHTPTGYAGLVPMPGGFYDAPAPPPIAPSKTPTGRPETRPEVYRHPSTSAYSEKSFTSSSTTARQQAEDDKNMFYNLWGGELVGTEPGKPGPRPKERLMDLLTSVALYLIRNVEPKNTLVVTEEKLRNFYTTFAMDDETVEWKSFFQTRRYTTLSRLFADLRCEHHLTPIVPHEVPTLPGLTPKGFETWMFTQLMINPGVEARRLQRILDKWPIHDHKNDQRFPKVLPRECLPHRRDEVMYGAWDELKNSYPPDQVNGSGPDEDDELSSPIYGSNLRGGDYSPAVSAPEEDDEIPISAHPPHAHSAHNAHNVHSAHNAHSAHSAQNAHNIHRRKSQPYNYVPLDVPLATEFLTKKELESDGEGPMTAPPIEERSRAPYGSSNPNPNWRDDLNPRPVLGEDTPPRPPTHHGTRSSRTPKPPSDGASAGSRHRRHKSRVRREPSPPPSWGSEDEDERPIREIEGGRAPSRGPGSGRKEWDHVPMGVHGSVYKSYPAHDEPPFPMTSPHSYGSADYDHHRRGRPMPAEEPAIPRHSSVRAKSRGPPKPVPVPAVPPQVDVEERIPIDEYRYQGDYMRATGGRPRRDTASSRKSGGAGRPHDYSHYRPH